MEKEKQWKKILFFEEWEWKPFAVRCLVKRKVFPSIKMITCIFLVSEFDDYFDLSFYVFSDHCHSSFFSSSFIVCSRYNLVFFFFDLGFEQDISWNWMRSLSRWMNILKMANSLKIMWFILLAWGSASARLRTSIPARTDIWADLSSNMINLINL